MRRVFDHAHHADGRSRVNRRTVAALVVETHVAACYGGVELAAGFAHAVDGVLELVIDFLVVRIAKVQAIGDGGRFAAGTNDVAGSFGYGNLGAFIGVGVNITAVAIHRQRETFLASLYLHNGCV